MKNIKKQIVFTKVELEFIKIIWAKGEVTTEVMQAALLEQGRDLSDGAIRRILAIMLEKGYISRRKEGYGFIYRAEVPQQTAQFTMANDLVNSLFGGSMSSMVAALMGNNSVSQKELQKIKKIISDHESEKT